MNTIKNSSKSSLDKYSFIKYVDMKREKYVKYKNILESKLNQIGGNQNTIEIKKIQEALLGIKFKINAIENGRKNTILDPYNKLKPLIDNINSKIEGIDKEINGIAEISDLESKLLVNRINEIDILIDKTAADYKGVYANSTVQFVKEKLDPEVYTGLISKYIHDTTAMVEDLKTKIGGSGSNLVDNEEIKNNIDAIEEKIRAYNEKMIYITGGDGPEGHIEGILEKIKVYLEQMESLYLGTKDASSDYKLLDTTFENYTDYNINYFSDGGDKFLKNPNKKGEEPAKDKVIVRPESSDTTNEFQYYREAVDEVQSKGGDEDEKTKELLQTNFIELPNATKTKYFKLEGGGGDIEIKPEIFTTELKKTEINKELVKLHNAWLEKVTAIRNEDAAILDYERIKTELIEKKVVLDKLLFKSVTIKDLLTSDLQDKLSKLEKVNLVIKETISNCNNVITEFRETKKVNTLINCKNDDIFTEKYKSDLLVEIMMILKTKKTEIEEQLEKINVGMKDPKVIASLMNKKDERHEMLIADLTALKKMFNDKISELTMDLGIKAKLAKIIKENYYIVDKNRYSYIEALLKFAGNDNIFDERIQDYQILAKRDANKELIMFMKYFKNENPDKKYKPIGTTETKEFSGLISFLLNANKQGESFLNYFIVNAIKLEKEISSFPVMTQEMALSKFVEAKTSLESKLSIINEFVGDFSTSAKSERTAKKYHSISPKIVSLVGGAQPSSSHLNQFILKLSEFEMAIRKMKVTRNEVKKLIRKYNIRYTQFFNFQKYVVNYVSLVLAQEEYSYWQLMSKGSISFYENILTRLESIIDKFEDPALFKVRETFMTKENIWFYSKHFFMIKILRKFFNEIYKFWEDNDIKFKEVNKYNSDDPTTLSSFTQIVNQKIAAKEEGYVGLSAEKVKSKAVRLYKRSIANKNPWNLTNKIDTLANVISNSPNKNYFFLFNIFFRILDVYQMKLPPVANYMRINFNQDIPATKEIVFEKSKTDKHYMQEENILKCFNVKAGEKPDPDADNKVKAVKNIYFEEVFDPDNFAENDALSMYMGLGNMLSEGKSVMLLTYGYSGVGKTFTLFGSKGVEGMLQSTLNGITGANKIEMKAFELYGLGVPYKFYWESNNFTHSLYKYELVDKDSTNIRKDPVEFKDNRESYKDFKKKLSESGKSKDDSKTFNSLLNENDHYTPILGSHIANFEEIVTNIDNIRREKGRIKSTINNPESSRSIMIYDFKITITIKGVETYPRLVVMDLPGKENLFQTYCENSFNRIYDPRERFVSHRGTPSEDLVGDDDTASVSDSSVGTAPNIGSAPAFGLFGQPAEKGMTPRSTSPASEKGYTPTGSVRSTSTGTAGRAPVSIPERTRLDLEKARLAGPAALAAARAAATPYNRQQAALVARPGGMYGGASKYDEKMIKAMMFINPLWLGVIPETAEHFDDLPNDKHLINAYDGTEFQIKTLTSYALTELGDKNTWDNFYKYQAINNNTTKSIVKNANTNTSHISEGIYADPLKRSLYGLTSRAVANITNLIKKPGGLETLGKKINKMLTLPDAREKRYGYAGLEGIYINENILGLLQVLSTKIQLSRPNKTVDNIVDVVCSQNEVYKSLIKDTKVGLTPISWDILQEDGLIENGEFIKDAPIFVQDNEFVSQIQILRTMIKSGDMTSFGEKKFFYPDGSDKYNNYMRDNDSLSLTNSGETFKKGLSRNIHDIEKNWINNYDYNKIFNIKNPPIKSILSPYLDDPMFQNFYLFFVTSNNVKEGPSGNIDTCGKQIQLMYDTRHFMEVIAKSDPSGVSGQCK